MEESKENLNIQANWQFFVWPLAGKFLKIIANIVNNIIVKIVNNIIVIF